MDSFLGGFVVLLALVVVFGFLNEKVTKLPHEIALMLFAVALGFILLVSSMAWKGTEDVLQILDGFQLFDMEAFLMEGVLCFMLFAGSCHMRLLDFKRHARIISLLAVGATFLCAVCYGMLFYIAGRLLGVSIDLPVCMMFGSIVAPTDPIAATSILKKFNLPSNISFIMEGESLLNDGVGVALFVFFSGIAAAQDSGGFFYLMAKELFGAVFVGAGVTAFCFPIFKRTGDGARKIFTSLLAVSLAYVLCEYFGFSGAVASVVCGVLFSALCNYARQKGEPLSLEQFDSFWSVLDTLLNSVLYVMLGLSFVRILQMPHVMLFSLVAILANFIGRAGSISVTSLFAGDLPDGYRKPEFIKLLTWGGMKGGLSAALAMSVQPMLEPELYHIILGGAYAIVFFTTIIQGLTMPRVYQSIQAGRGKA